MNILSIYKKYQIMPQLQEHQLRVAAVAETILDHLPVSPSASRGGSLILDRHEIVVACLLHDMGNILKFDLTKTKSLLNAEIDVAFWEKAKEDFRQKFGNDEHRAALEIAGELGARKSIIEFIDCIGFNNGPANAATPDFGKKICAYSDMRVGPRGVISLEERFMDLRARYESKFHIIGGNEEKRLEFENGLREIEKQIFERCNIKPEEITEAAIADTKENLKSFEI